VQVFHLSDRLAIGGVCSLDAIVTLLDGKSKVEIRIEPKTTRAHVILGHSLTICNICQRCAQRRLGLCEFPVHVMPVPAD
jgi:hypothetical protein